ncbi:hypothetical protein [Bowmanella dokdonensis]|uniref:Uncharacterized protein n=1 Tax=Bowmanella dokdonensis TaxID=751969 RepID=A0A939DJK7_9ALTE|nr:hypothetical protein [Bowmanella dokdonensis]MBN7823837.1 hypothetical protein [Bowmanella dokdonensis]
MSVSIEKVSVNHPDKQESEKKAGRRRATFQQWLTTMSRNMNLQQMVNLK